MRCCCRGLLCSAVLGLAAYCFADSEKPVVLFNGMDLTGFTPWLKDTGKDDPRRVFSVENGCIRISGDGYGYLATEQEFENYRLDLEFRWGDQVGLDRGGRAGKALDSGIFLHATGADGNSHDGEGAYMAAIECNVFQGATGDILLIRGSRESGELIAPRVTVESGSSLDRDGFPTWEAGGEPRSLETWGRVNWKDKSAEWQDRLDWRGANDLERPYGEWNTLACVCRQDTITVILNGQEVNRVTGVWPQKGKILLQCEAAEILFRNIRLSRLPAGR